MNEIFDIWTQQYLLDVQEVIRAYPHWYMYVFVMGYIPLMAIKWAALTLPAWLPFAIVAYILKEQKNAD
jgi:hypothetical protein